MKNTNKLLIKNFEYFSKPNAKIQKINDSEKKSNDAKKIYTLIAKVQKIKYTPEIISKMANETDYLEKLLDAFRSYLDENHAKIQDLIKALKDYSVNQVETTRALMNFYNSNENINQIMIENNLNPNDQNARFKYKNFEIGKEYLDEFAFSTSSNYKELSKKEHLNYNELNDSGLLEIANKAKQYSVNLNFSYEENKKNNSNKIESDIESGAGSAVVYKIDRINNIVYFLSNEHIASAKNIHNIKIQFIIPDLSNSEYDAFVVGCNPEVSKFCKRTEIDESGDFYINLSDGAKVLEEIQNFRKGLLKPENLPFRPADIALFAAKLSSEDISKINEPEISNINDNSYRNQKIVLVGNSKGFGSEDFSTNASFGKIDFINHDIDDDISYKQLNDEYLILCRNNFIEHSAIGFPGNSGSGVWDENGKLIGIYYATNKSTIEDSIHESKKNYKGYAVPIFVAKEIADNLIHEYEKSNNIQNGIFHCSKKQKNKEKILQNINIEINEIKQIQFNNDQKKN